MLHNRPIAVLDSGIGGLSVLKALKNLMPNEEIFYFGDTAHFPYGIKSTSLIKELSLKVSRKIVEVCHPKVLVIACHTISTTCLMDLNKALNIEMIGINEPSIKALKKTLKEEKLREMLILSTKATLSSGKYAKAWQEMPESNDIKLHEFACGPLVNLVEDGYSSEAGLLAISDQIIPKTMRNADAVLLGCTHFPVLEPVLKKLFKPTCSFIDAAPHCAKDVLDFLLKNNLLNDKNNKSQELIAYVSDNKERFIENAKQFIKEPIFVRDL